MTDVDGILSRFEKRSEEAASKPARKFEPPPPPKARPQVPTDPQEIRILRGAAVLAAEMLPEYSKESAEYTALVVLINFVRKMTS